MALATCQRIIDRVIGIDLKKYAFVFLDDTTIKLYLQKSKGIFKLVLMVDLTFNENNCNFCKSKLK